MGIGKNSKLIIIKQKKKGVIVKTTAPFIFLFKEESQMEKIVFTTGEKRTLIIAGVGIAVLGYGTGRFIIEPAVKKVHDAVVNLASKEENEKEKEHEEEQEKEEDTE